MTSHLVVETVPTAALWSDVDGGSDVAAVLDPLLVDPVNRRVSRFVAAALLDRLGV